MAHIIIVEDEEELRGELKTLLERNGYEVSALTCFENICEDILCREADMVLLDILLPHTDGELLLRKLRKKSDIPVIMLTSRNTEMDEVLCMSLGADDFIAKPYNPSILLLHIEAILKRIHPEEEKINFRGMVLDSARSVMLVNGKETELSKNENRILTYLLRHVGQVVSRDELMGYLWDNEEFVDDNTLTVNINRVRRKLEENGLFDVICTKRGQGYRIG